MIIERRNTWAIFSHDVVILDKPCCARFRSKQHEAEQEKWELCPFCGEKITIKKPVNNFDGDVDPFEGMG
jgi:hypothetical protein